MENSTITRPTKNLEVDEGVHLIDFEANGLQRTVPYCASETLSEHGTGASGQSSSSSRRGDPSVANRVTSTIGELKGYAIIFTSALFLGVTATAIRSSQTNYSYDPFQTVNLIGTQVTIYSTIYIILFSSFKKIFSAFTYEDYFKLIIRGTAGAVTICAFSFALRLLPSGYAISIFYTGPIITIILSSIILSERPGLSCYFASIIAFFGVLLVSHQSSTSPISMLGVSMAFLAALFGSLIPIAVRALVSSAHFITSPLALGFACFIITSCLGRYVSLQSVFKNQKKEVIIASLLPGVSTFFGQFLLGIGFQFCRASSGAVIRSLEIPTAFVSSALMLHENPIPIRLVGSGVILLATVMVTLGKVYGF